MFKTGCIYLFVVNARWDTTMSGQRQRVKFEQLTESERKEIMCFHEAEFANCAIAAHVQRNNSTAMRISKRWIDENQPTRKSGSERQKMISMLDDSYLVRMTLLKSTTSSRKCAAHWCTASGALFSASFIRWMFLFRGLCAWTPLCRIPLTQNYGNLKLQLSQEHRYW